MPLKKKFFFSVIMYASDPCDPVILAAGAGVCPRMPGRLS